MTDQADLMLIAPRHMASRDEMPNPYLVPDERRCLHMVALSIGKYFHCHIPDMGFECLICFDCKQRLHRLGGTYFLPALIV